MSSLLFFFTTYQPDLTQNIFHSISYTKNLPLIYIELTSMTMSAISIILFIIANYYEERRLLREREKLAKERLTIEEIHAELEALKN
jgi:hypothetical protein